MSTDTTTDTFSVLMPTGEMAADDGAGMAAAFWTTPTWQVTAHRESDEVWVRPPDNGVDVDASRLVLAAVSARLWLSYGTGWIGLRGAS